MIALLLKVRDIAGMTKINLIGLTLDEVQEASVEVVWEPMWTTDNMSEAAKLQLGMV